MTVERLAMRLNSSRPVALSKIRLICSSAQRNGIQIKSTLDNTYKLDHTVDEDIAFTDEDLIAIRNNSGAVCDLTLKAIQLKDGRRAILSPARRGHVTLIDPEISPIRSECTLTLGVDETCMLRTSLWQGRAGAGAAFPV